MSKSAVIRVLLRALTKVILEGYNTLDFLQYTELTYNKEEWTQMLYLHFIMVKVGII